MSENLSSTQNACRIARPYCFSLPERSDVNARDPETAPWCDSCIHFTECQEAHERRPRILTLHLKEQYFRKIAAGTKTEEYREATHYWRKRLQGKTFDVIEICNRYPERGDIENRIWFRFTGSRIVLMKWDNAGVTVSGPTFAIPLKGRLDYPYQAMEEIPWNP